MSGLSKGFSHGTVRSWKNGTHLKNGQSWERVKTGRRKKALPFRQEIETSPYGYDSSGVFTDPNDFSQSPAPAFMVFGLSPEVISRMENFAAGTTELELDEKIQSPRTPKGRAAFFKSLHGWAKAATKVASSYADKLGDADPKEVEDHMALRKALGEVAKSMEIAFKLADKNTKR